MAALQARLDRQLRNADRHTDSRTQTLRQNVSQTAALRQGALHLTCLSVCLFVCVCRPLCDVCLVGVSACVSVAALTDASGRSPMPTRISRIRGADRRDVTRGDKPARRGGSLWVASGRGGVRDALFQLPGPIARLFSRGVLAPSAYDGWTPRASHAAPMTCTAGQLGAASPL